MSLEAPWVDWSSQFSVGIKQFDDQHRELVRLLNQLHETVLEQPEGQAVGEALGALVHHARVHFADEERLMAAHGFPGYAEHQTKHVILLRQAGDLHRHVAAGQFKVSQHVLNLLRDWLLGHIRGSDAEYGPYLNSKGVL